MSPKKEKNDFVFPLEYLHTDALCENMPSCTALLVFAGSGNGVLKELKKLYRQSHVRIFYTEDLLHNRLPFVLEAAKKKHSHHCSVWRNNTGNTCVPSRYTACKPCVPWNRDSRSHGGVS